MSDLGAIIRWLVALEVIGWGLFPLLYLALPGLRDRGLTLVKPFAVLLLVFPVWFLASSGLPIFAPQALLISGILLTILGWGIALRQRAETGAGDAANASPDIVAFLRGAWRYVVLTEVIFIATFLFYLWLRSFNPQVLGTEKPMEMGFLSAATRDTVLPPRDPWLSGYGINYYYLGFVLVAALAKLTGISATIAFNLGLATVFAMAFSGGAGLVANLVAVARDGERRLPRASTLAIGTIGGYLLVFAGNMYAARDILANGATAIETWWWGGLGWKASRVVIDTGFPAAIYGANAGPSETITEFPFFSFILGDLHAHVLALPYTLLALGFALDTFLAPLFGAPGARFAPRTIWRIAAAALTIGGLYALNSWDLPTYAVLYVAASAIPFYLAERRVGRDALAALVGFAVATFALYLPFYRNFTSLVGGRDLPLPEPLASMPLIPKIATILGVVIWNKTPIDQFFTVYLLPWVVGVIVLIWRWQAGRGEAAGGYTHPLLSLLALALVATIIRMPVLFFGGTIVFLAGAIVRQRRTCGESNTGKAQTDLFVVGLFAAAFALVILTEVFFIQDVFGNRMNTIFKVYYQAWSLLAVGTGYAIVRVLTLRPFPLPRIEQWRIPASGAIALLLLATLAYPLASARARTDDFNVASDLDGLSFIRTAAPDEYDGINWVMQNVPAGSVVAEAPGCSYGELNGMPHDRVSTFAGVSTPLGWGGHESQWRGGSPAILASLGTRDADVNRLYSTTDPVEASALLDRYNIAYVYVGVFERNGYKQGGIGADCQAGGAYPAAGLAKFDTMMQRVYTSPGGAVAIYKHT
jgi:YYY domain-containing protein